MFAWFVSDDLLRGVPREQRMPMDRLVNPTMEFLFSDEARGRPTPAPISTPR